MAVSGYRLKQRGVALITALLVTTLATVVAVSMANRQQLDIRRTGNVLNADQAWAYAEGVEDWSRVILQRDLDDNQTDHLNEAWATQLAPIPVEGGQILGRLEDQQGRFNLNNLFTADAEAGTVSEPDLTLFRRLLTNLELDVELADALLDWMDADLEARFPGGAEDNEYLLLDPPYRPANRSLSSVTELAAVKGFDARAVARLQPYVTVLPGRTKLNVNTAAAEILRVLHEDLTQADAEALIAARGDNGFEKLDEFLAEPVLAGREIQVETAVASDYFLLDAEVDIGMARSQLYSLLHRGGQGIEVVLRSRGVW